MRVLTAFVDVDEIAWLGEAGHEIAHFSTQHPSNEPSPWSEYFVPYLKLGGDGQLEVFQKTRAAIRMFYNREAASRQTRLLLEFRPDVIHVHGIHRQLSPSILAAARERNVPVVHTMHDYFAVCPADVLLWGDGTLCDPGLCRAAAPWPAILHRCVRGSLAQSSLSAAETFFRTRFMHFEELVTRFISPSQFLADRLRAAGMMRRPIDVLPNAIAEQPQGAGGAGFLFAGRLAREKGLRVLLDAARQANLELTIAGDGPLAQLVRERSSQRVRWVGSVPSTRVIELLGQCTAAVVPSTWFENAPLSILEPMAAGTPVVASAIGGIPELVRHGVDGLLVRPDSVDSLATAMNALAEHPENAHRMGLDD